MVTPDKVIKKCRKKGCYAEGRMVMHYVKITPPADPAISKEDVTEFICSYCMNRPVKQFNRRYRII